MTPPAPERRRRPGPPARPRRCRCRRTRTRATPASTWSPPSTRSCRPGSGCCCPPASRSPCPRGTPPSCTRGRASRSGTACSLVNAPGTVDAGYRGEIAVSLVNLDPREPVVLHRGDRIAQLVVQRVEHAVFHEVERAARFGPGRGWLRLVRPLASSLRVRPAPADREESPVFRRRKSAENEPEIETEVDDVVDEELDDRRSTTSRRRRGRRRRRPLERSVRRRPRCPTTGSRASTSAASRCRASRAWSCGSRSTRRPTQVVAVTVVTGDSAVQLMVFAAPRTEGIWDDVRGEIRANLAGSGLVDEVDGRLRPRAARHAHRDRRPDGKSMMQPVRFVGVDGPRWFLRGLFSGARRPRDRPRPRRSRPSLRACVVVRGSDPMAPGDPLPAARAERGARGHGAARRRRRQRADRRARRRPSAARRSPRSAEPRQRLAPRRRRRALPRSRAGAVACAMTRSARVGHGDRPLAAPPAAGAAGRRRARPRPWAPRSPASSSMPGPGLVPAARSTATSVGVVVGRPAARELVEHPVVAVDGSAREPGEHRARAEPVDLDAAASGGGGDVVRAAPVHAGITSASSAAAAGSRADHSARRRARRARSPPTRTTRPPSRSCVSTASASRRSAVVDPAPGVERDGSTSRRRPPGASRSYAVPGHDPAPCSSRVTVDTRGILAGDGGAGGG